MATQLDSTCRVMGRVVPQFTEDKCPLAAGGLGSYRGSVEVTLGDLAFSFAWNTFCLSPKGSLTSRLESTCYCVGK